MGKTIKRTNCDYCKSSDNVSFWIDSFGNERSRCLTPNCDYNKQTKQTFNDNHISELYTNGSFTNLIERKISQNTCEKFNYLTAKIHNQDAHIENHYNLENELVAQKIRYTANKKFEWVGSVNNLRLGMGPVVNTQTAVICEGALDAMSVYEVCPEYQIFYLTGGAGDQTKSELQRNFKILDQYKDIILCFDNDRAGLAALNQNISLFPIGSVRVPELGDDDPNEYLKKDKRYNLRELITKAPIWKPKALQIPTIELLLEPEEMGYDLQYPQLNTSIRGLRLGRLYTLLAGSGIGKSSFTKELVFGLIEKYHDLNVGLAYLEEPLKTSGLGFVSLDLKLPVYKLEEEIDQYKEKITESYNKLINSGRLRFIDASFMSLNGGDLIYHLEYMITVDKCKIIVLDHITMITYDLIGENSERKDIDILMKNLRALVHRTGASIIMVSHLKRPGQGRSWAEGREVQMTDARGSAALEQLSDVMIALERDMTDEVNKNKTKVKVLKNRISGLTGYVDELYYIENTGRLVTIDQLFK